MKKLISLSVFIIMILMVVFVKASQGSGNDKANSINNDARGLGTRLLEMVPQTSSLCLGGRPLETHSCTQCGTRSRFGKRAPDF